MNQMKKVERHILFCEPCAFKKIIQSEDDEPLTEIARSGIQVGLPTLDQANQRTIASKTRKLPKQYKCPKCGRGVTLKKLPVVYEKAYAAIDAQEQKKHLDHERMQRFLDGAPIVRKPEDEESVGP